VHHLERDVREAVLATLQSAISVAGGPTPEQQALVDLVGTHVLAVDGAHHGPIGPEEAAEAIVDADLRRLVGEGLITLELMAHPADPALVDRVDRYLTALGFEGPEQILVRDAVAGERDRVIADWTRTRTPSVSDPTPATDESAVLARVAGLKASPPGTLGRSLHDFTQRHGFAYEEGHLSLIGHDFAHVIAGYEAVPEGELALQAFLVAAMGGGAHASGLLATLLLDEVGLLPFPDVEPKVAVLDRPGATELFVDAVLRGSGVGLDVQLLDHLELADRDLVELRTELGIPAPVPGRFTFVV